MIATSAVNATKVIAVNAMEFTKFILFSPSGKNCFARKSGFPLTIFSHLLKQNFISLRVRARSTLKKGSSIFCR